jgi:hypothetical protein
MGRPSGSFTGLIQSLANIGAARKNAAGADLDRQLLAAQKGFPVDPKAIQKSAKKAGIPLMSNEDMEGMMKQPQQGGQSQQGQPQQKQLQGPVSKNDPYNVKAITNVNDRQKMETNHAVDGMVRQAVTNAHLRGQDEQSVLNLTHQLMQLKTRALNGDPRALGQLSAAGELKIDIPTETWNSYNPKQKGQFLEMQRGAETEAQKNQRTQAAATHLIDAGSFTDPQSAYQAATVLADGGSMSPELQSKMRPTSLNDLVSEVGIAGKLADIGLTGNQITSTVRGANLTGIGNYFPTGFHTIQQQELAQKNTELGIQKQQTGIEGANAQTSRMQVTGIDKKGPDGKITHTPGELENQASEAQARMAAAQNVASRLNNLTKTQADRDFVAQYTALVDLKRSGGQVDPDVISLMEKKLVEKSGGSITVDQAKDFWNYVSFGYLSSGTHPVMKVGMSPEAAQQTFGMGSSTSTDTNDNTDPAAAAAGSPQ